MLKPVIASLEEVPEALRGEYKPIGDGRFMLDTNVEEHPQLSALKSSLINAREERNQAKDKLQALAGVDPAKYQELLKQETLIKEGKLIAEGKLDELVALRTTALREDLTGKLTAAETKTKEMQATLDRLVIDNAVHAAAAKTGVRKTAVPDVIERARSMFSTKDGVAVAVQNGQVVYGKDGVTPLGIEEWLSGLPTAAPHLFEDSKGGGAVGGAPATKPATGPGVVSRGDQQGFLANLDKIAKGQIKVM